MNQRKRSIAMSAKKIPATRWWKIEERCEYYFEDSAPGFCGRDYSDADYDQWTFHGTEGEVRRECEETWIEYHGFEFDSIPFNEYASDGRTFEASDYEYDEDGSTTVTIRRRYSEYDPDARVRLIRYLDVDDMEMLNRDGEILPKGVSHKWNSCGSDGHRVFCFIEGRERDWPREGYVPSVARIVIEVKEDRVDYHSANYDYSNSYIKEASISVIKKEDIVEMTEIPMSSRDLAAVAECDQEIQHWNNADPKCYHDPNWVSLERRAWPHLKELVLARRLKGSSLDDAESQLLWYLEAGKPIDEWQYRAR